MLGVSQTALGEALKLTFQQVQKYERGANRVSASVLFRAAERLQVPVSYFFDGLGDPLVTPAENESARSTLVLVRSLNSLPTLARDAVKEFVHKLQVAFA